MSRFADLVDLIAELVRRVVPEGTKVDEYPGIIDVDVLKKIAAAGVGRVSILLGYGGQGEVQKLQSGDACVKLSFAVFVIAKGRGEVVKAGRQAAAISIELAQVLSSFAPAAGLPVSEAGPGPALAGVLGVTPAEDIVVETDSTSELLKEHILFNLVSWSHGLIIGQPGEYAGDPVGALTSVEWDRPDEGVQAMDGDTIDDLGGEP